MKLSIVRPGQRTDKILIKALRKSKLELCDGDVVAVASKIVSTAEERTISLDDAKVSKETLRIARKWHIDRRLVAVVRDEADVILGGVPGFLLTLKNGILTANAGIDLKNSPGGTAIRWPSDADASASTIRKSLEHEFHARIGVIIVDSRVTPMRLGTVGLAIGASGLVPTRDDRGRSDLYGRKTKVTQTNVIDDLASSAHLLMGETSERIAAVVVRKAPIRLQKRADSKGARLRVGRCLIASNLRNLQRVTQYQST